MPSPMRSRAPPSAPEWRRSRSRRHAARSQHATALPRSRDAAGERPDDQRAATWPARARRARRSMPSPPAPVDVRRRAPGGSRDIRASRPRAQAASAASRRAPARSAPSDGVSPAATASAMSPAWSTQRRCRNLGSDRRGPIWSAGTAITLSPNMGRMRHWPPRDERRSDAPVQVLRRSSRRQQGFYQRSADAIAARRTPVSRIPGWRSPRREQFI